MLRLLASQQNSAMINKVEIGEHVLYHADCLSVLPTLEGVDCVVTDPPYGLKRDKGFGGFGGFGTPIPRTQYEGEWDLERPSPEVFNLITQINPCLIFGGNYFADLLPQGKHWIVWDKKNTMPTFGDAELIWTNVGRNSVKIKTHEWNGLLGKEKTRYHATQKPVALIMELISDYCEGTICDPFMGSGSTGVACARLGRKFIGIEIDEGYFNIACERIDREVCQLKLPLAVG